jgi:hypothetical protein
VIHKVKFRYPIFLLALISLSFITLPHLSANENKAGEPKPGSDQQSKSTPKKLLYSSHAKPFGMTYGEWSARWWQYIISIPPEDNPLFDFNGAKCGVGQYGPVFFLVGVGVNDNPPPAQVTRDCAIPAGKAVLIPISNNLCAVPEDGTDAQAIAKLCKELQDSIPVESISVEIGTGNGKDGPLTSIKRLERFRFQSPPFISFGTTPNVFSKQGCASPPAPKNRVGICYEGYHKESFADGYWIMTKPLTEGEYTVKIKVKDIPDITYHLQISHPVMH